MAGMDATRFTVTAVEIVVGDVFETFGGKRVDSRKVRVTCSDGDRARLTFECPISEQPRVGERLRTVVEPE